MQPHTPKTPYTHILYIERLDITLQMITNAFNDMCLKAYTTDILNKTLTTILN